MIQSKINPILTLDYMTKEHENKYFDRKSAKIRPKDLGDLISAFANAEGGTIVIGIDDKTLEIEGINSVGQDKINDFINAPKDYCKPMPINQFEYIPVTNNHGKNDRLLLLHIFPSGNQIVQTRNDATWLRIGDRTKEIKGADLRNLEYSKNTRKYEDECNMDATLEDLDSSLLQRYKIAVGAENVPIKQVLLARGLMKKVKGKDKLTNAAVLLFAKQIMQFYPNCRIRFVRYDGDSAHVGTQINIIKDKNMDYSILNIIDRAKEYIANQLREFTALDEKTGKFKIVPEYPEFAWVEGIVNAVVHREYALSGDYILVTMYDDRLEIKSPGKLPDIVTIDNIQYTRYSRNPKISRVLNEFGYVRELNEGVKRIYKDMESFFLEKPVYSEPGQQSVKLTLKNNILMRKLRRQERLISVLGTTDWDGLDDLEKEILTYMGSHGQVTSKELSEYTGKAKRTVLVRINHLIAVNIIKSNGKSHDPKQTYSLIAQ